MRPAAAVFFSACAALCSIACWPRLALARPTAPGVVCELAPAPASCDGAVPSCALCHDSTDPPSWNVFGQALRDEMGEGAVFESELLRALNQLAEGDADGDGSPNLEELTRGSDPAVVDPSGVEGDGGVMGSNPRYRVGEYDPAFALKRVAILYCGRSPTYEEMHAFRAEADEETLRRLLHDKLDDCLASDYWQDEALARMADKRIRPLTAAGPDSNIQIAGYRLVIGDYGYDYRMWRYVLTGDRDLRDLLLAQYHVVEAEDGSLSEIGGLLEKSDSNALAGGQLVPEGKRAGMLTTQWFLAINTMFSDMPRTTAAQAYRSYLGADISSNQGLRPVDGEPLDVDDKGVDAPRCAVCHSTLDPLTYAFAEYEGIQNSVSLEFGAYRPERPLERMPAWDMTRQQSVVLGVPVDDLVQWAQVAAESDEFKRAMAAMFFEHALSREPLPEEQSAFSDLWHSMPEDGYSANRLLHRLIDLPTFGRP